MYRVSTVYQPYIYRVCTVVVSVRTAHNTEGLWGVKRKKSMALVVVVLFL